MRVPITFQLDRFPKKKITDLGVQLGFREIDNQSVSELLQSHDLPHLHRVMKVCQEMDCVIRCYKQMYEEKKQWLQTTQNTSGGAVTADTNCCANRVKTSHPQQWVPDL